MSNENIDQIHLFPSYSNPPPLQQSFSFCMFSVHSLLEFASRFPFFVYLFVLIFSQKGATFPLVRRDFYRDCLFLFVLSLRFTYVISLLILCLLFTFHFFPWPLFLFSYSFFLLFYALLFTQHPFNVKHLVISPTSLLSFNLICTSHFHHFPPLNTLHANPFILPT